MHRPVHTRTYRSIRHTPVRSAILLALHPCPDQGSSSRRRTSTGGPDCYREESPSVTSASSPTSETRAISIRRSVHARCTVQNNRCPFIGKYVEQRIRALPPDEVAESRAKGYPSVLVIGPKEFARPTYRYLSEHLPSVEYRIGSSMDCCAARWFSEDSCATGPPDLVGGSC